MTAEQRELDELVKGVLSGTPAKVEVSISVLFYLFLWLHNFGAEI